MKGCWKGRLWDVSLGLIEKPPLVCFSLFFFVFFIFIPQGNVTGRKREVWLCKHTRILVFCHLGGHGAHSRTFQERGWTIKETIKYNSITKEASHQLLLINNTTICGISSVSNQIQLYESLPEETAWRCAPSSPYLHKIVEEWHFLLPTHLPLSIIDYYVLYFPVWPLGDN